MQAKADYSDLFEQGTNPERLFQEWFDEADRTELNDSNAMTLATVDASGLPNARVVLLKGTDAQGFVFYTNCESTKGQELAANAKAALCFHWKSLRRQVRVRGYVEQTTTLEADAYYATRPRGSRIGAWASQQSRPLGSRAELEEAFGRFEKEFEGINPVRPRYWSGYRVVPLEIEFWADRPHRLHDRVVFRRNGPDEPWSKTRLYP